jgi:hypothetical protein
MQISDLKNKVGWIAFTFPDGSVRVIRTTLNEEILAPYLKDKGDKDLFDLDKVRWTKLPTNPEVVVNILEERPTLGEVDEFANRFI